MLLILESAIKAGGSAARSLAAIRDNGFVPDFVFSAASGGFALAIRDIFPASPWLNFLQGNFCEKRPNSNRVVQTLQIAMAIQTFSFFPSLKSQYPPELATLIKLAKPLVDVEFFRPAFRKGVKRLAVFHMCSTHYGFHSLLRETALTHYSLQAFMPGWFSMI